MFDYGAYPYEHLPESSYQNWLKRGCSSTYHRLSSHITYMPITSKKKSPYNQRKYFVKFIINNLCKKHGLGKYLVSKHIMDYYDITSLKSPISEAELYVQKSKNKRKYWITKQAIPMPIRQIIMQQWSNYNNRPLPWYNETPHKTYYSCFGDLKWFHYECVVRKRWFIYDLYKKNFVLKELLKDNQVYPRSKLKTKQQMVEVLMKI